MVEYSKLILEMETKQRKENCKNRFQMFISNEEKTFTKVKIENDPPG